MIISSDTYLIIILVQISDGVRNLSWDKSRESRTWKGAELIFFVNFLGDKI